jgi:hypothetical protein
MDFFDQQQQRATSVPVNVSKSLPGIVVCNKSVVPDGRGQRSDPASPALTEHNRDGGDKPKSALLRHEQRIEGITSDGDSGGGR